MWGNRVKVVCNHRSFILPHHYGMSRRGLDKLSAGVILRGEMEMRKGLTPEMVNLKAMGLSYRAIGEQVGVTRQRIQQLFTLLPPTMAVIYERAGGCCETCNIIEQFGHYHHKVYDFAILNETDNILYLCTPCHSRNGRNRKKLPKTFCPNCGAPKSHRLTFCSRACYKASHKDTMTCSECRKSFTLQASDKRARIQRNNSGVFFCSKHCQGVYLGKHHKPGQRVRSPSKYLPLIPIITMRMSKGEPLSVAMMNEGVPRGSYLDIKRLITERRSPYSETGTKPPARV